MAKAKTQIPADRPLTPKQKRFVQEYLFDCNASAAIRRAGYSEKAANVKSAQLMADPRIQQAIQEAMKEQQKRLEVTADDVLRHIMELAFLDMARFAEWDREGRVTFKASDEQGVDGRMIKKIKSTRRMLPGGTEEREAELELINKEKMLEMLFRHFGLAAPIKLETEVSLADVLERAWAMRPSGGANAIH